MNYVQSTLASGGESATRARAINDSLTAHIREAYQHSEVKAVDASLSGFVMQHRAGNIAFEGTSEQDARDLFGGAKPAFVVEATRQTEWDKDVMQVPKSVWREAKKRNIPFVFVDA